MDESAQDCPCTIGLNSSRQAPLPGSQTHPPRIPSQQYRPLDPTPASSRLAREPIVLWLHGQLFVSSVRLNPTDRTWHQVDGRQHLPILANHPSPHIALGPFLLLQPPTWSVGLFRAPSRASLRRPSQLDRGLARAQVDRAPRIRRRRAH